MKLSLSLALVATTASLIAVEPTPRQVQHQPAPPYTDDEISNLVGIAKPPEGVALVDVAKQLNNAMSVLSKQGICR
jgi:hypothetical protein